MHPNPVYRNTSEAAAIAFAIKRGFGVLAVNGSDAPVTAHIPFVIGEDGKTVRAHLMRSNALYRLLDKPKQALLTVSGPDGYVSPDWYGLDDQVPTWNYIAVNLRGSLTATPQDQLHQVLEALSERFEADLAPKSPWRIEKMTPEKYQRMLKMICPIELAIESVESTWKLGQNKPVEAIRGAADSIATGTGMELHQLADMMREVKSTA